MFSQYKYIIRKLISQLPQPTPQDYFVQLTVRHSLASQNSLKYLNHFLSQTFCWNNFGCQKLLFDEVRWHDITGINYRWITYFWNSSLKRNFTLLSIFTDSQKYSVVILVVNIGKTFVWYKLQWAVQARPAAVGLILQNNKMNTFDALTAKLNTELFS